MPVVGFIFDVSIMNSNLWNVTKNVFGVSAVSKEIACADRIVYGTGIYKGVLVSAKVSECVFSILKWKDCPD